MIIYFKSEIREYGSRNLVKTYTYTDTLNIYATVLKLCELFVVYVYDCLCALSSLVALKESVCNRAILETLLRS